jgi:crotonobetainyl-CoA:carnitine CoA-transferase CaiB-like acyl-CoA transferase
MDFIPGGGATLVCAGRNKKGIVLDLWNNSGKQAFYDLVRVSDVVLDNYRGTDITRKMGIDYETLKELNPRIICASLAGYGATGSYSDYPSYDAMAIAISGMASLSGGPTDAKPLMPNPGTADCIGGLMTAIGIVTALHERERTGVGRKVQVSLLDACMALLQREFQHYFFFGQPPQRQGSISLSIPPLGFYRCRNGYIALGSCWPQICKAIGMQWLADDSRFVDLDSRILHRKELEDLLEEGLQQVDVEEWLEKLRVEDIPCGPVNTHAKALEDPQVIHNKAETYTEHPTHGRLRSIASPTKIAAAIEGEDTCPPALGEHTEEVLKNILGYSDEKIAMLKKEEEENFEEMQKHVRKQF